MNILRKNKRSRKHITQTSGLNLTRFMPLEKGRKYRKKRKRQFTTFTSSAKKRLYFITHQKKRYYLICAIIVLTLGIGSIIYSPLFSIQYIDIYKLSPLINQEKAYNNVAHARGKHILTYDTKYLAESLKKGQSSIRGVKTSFHFPSKIKIVLSSYEPLFQTQDYIILENGSVISKDRSYSLEAQQIELSEDISQYILEKKQLSELELKKIIQFLDKITATFPTLSAKKIRYHTQEKELHIEDAYENILIFDLFRDVSQSISQAAIFHEEGESLMQKKWVYVDFRIPGKTYSCERNQEGVPCENNMKSLYGEILSP